MTSCPLGLRMKTRSRPVAPMKSPSSNTRLSRGDTFVRPLEMVVSSGVSNSTAKSLSAAIVVKLSMKVFEASNTPSVQIFDMSLRAGKSRRNSSVTLRPSDDEPKKNDRLAVGNSYVAAPFAKATRNFRSDAAPQIWMRGCQFGKAMLFDLKGKSGLRRNGCRTSPCRRVD